MKYLFIIVVAALIVYQGYCPKNDSNTWHCGHVLDNSNHCHYCGGHFPL